MKRLLIVLPVLAALVASSSVAAAPPARLPGFHSPTGNIRCMFVPSQLDDIGHRLPSTLLCSAARADYAAALQRRCMGPPGGGGVDWHGWTLSQKGKGLVECSGGILYNPVTQHPRYVNLPYGTTWRQGVFTCVSRVTGVTCRNRTGHGVFISRGSWRAW